MQSNQSRSYSYDDQQDANYPNPLASPDNSYPLPNTYQRGSYDQQDAPGQYYVPSQQPSGIAVPDPRIRSTSPAVSSHHRYARDGNAQRQYQSSSMLPSSLPTSNHTSQHGSYYQPQTTPYNSPSTSRSHAQSTTSHSQGQSSGQFFPTPSDLVHSYPNHYPSHPSLPQQHQSSSPTDMTYPHSYRQPHQVGISTRARSPSVLAHTRNPPLGITRPRTAAGTSLTVSPTSPTSPGGERFVCEICGKSFSRSHDRKRHHETQHLPVPVVHRCRYCRKEFSRGDSLKRHQDNGCDERP